MKKVLKLLITLSVSTSCYAMDLPGSDQQKSSTSSPKKILNETIEPQTYEKGSIPAYQTALDAAETKEDLLRFLMQVVKDSYAYSDCYPQVYQYFDLEKYDFFPYTSEHPIVFEGDFKGGDHFVSGFDDRELMFAITAKTADHYGILSNLQDKLTESGLATKCVHVVGPADEIQFPSFQYYFDECKRKGILFNTIAIDLKNNLTLIECIEKAREKYLKNLNDPAEINVNIMLSNVAGEAYDKYAKDAGQKIIINYIDKFIQDTNFSGKLDEFDLYKEHTPFEMYGMLQKLAASYPELLILNDYDVLTPRFVNSFQELQRTSGLSDQQQEPLNIIVKKILDLQARFEKLKESHRPAHQQLLKETMTQEGVVPLSVPGCMQCRSSFLNQDGNKFLSEIFPDWNVDLYDISDIESFMRFFHEKGTFIKTLERNDENVTGSLDLLDMHLILERLPISNEKAKKLGNSYKMLGQFHMGETVYGFPIQVHGLRINQYVLLNLIYQMVKNPQPIAQTERDKKTNQIQKIITNDNTVMIPMHFCAENLDNSVSNINFNGEKFILPKCFMEAQQKTREEAMEKFLKSKPVYYIRSQDGRQLENIEWFFY